MNPGDTVTRVMLLFSRTTPDCADVPAWHNSDAEVSSEDHSVGANDILEYILGAQHQQRL